MKKNLRVTRKKKNLKQLLLMGVCAITLATSIPATETAFAQYSYEFTVPQYTAKNIEICIDVSNKMVFFLCPLSSKTKGDFMASLDLRWLDQTPVVINGRTFVPMRAVFEALGCTVNWDQDSRTATVTKDNTTVKLTIGNTTMQVSKNGSNSHVALDAAPVVINGRTLLPLRAPAEAFGYTVTWEAKAYDHDGRIYIRDSETQAKEDEWKAQTEARNAEIEAERQAEAAEQAAQDAAYGAVREEVNAILTEMDKQYRANTRLDDQSYCAEVVKCINIARAKYSDLKGGLTQLTMDTGAFQAASQIRAKECEVKWDHVRPNGSMWHSAIEGFDAAHNYSIGGYTPSAEILENKTNSTASPAAHVLGWLSSVHVVAVLDKEATKISVGIHDNGTRTYCAAITIKER